MSSESAASVQDAAILLMSLGETHAAQIMRHMDAKEVQRIGEAMSQLDNINQEQVRQTLDVFLEDSQEETGLTVDADRYIRTMLTQALGPDRANSVIERILMGGNTSGLDTLKWMEPRSVADLVRNEHPQIIAIVLSHLDADQAAAVLLALPERSRADVVMRIATLEGIPPHALHELDDILERQFAGNQNLKSSTIGGVKVAGFVSSSFGASLSSSFFSSSSAAAALEATSFFSESGLSSFFSASFSAASSLTFF